MPVTLLAGPVPRLVDEWQLAPSKLAQLASLCVITGGQTSFTRPDGIHGIALAHLRP
jgi:hypothetical protein